MRISVIIPTLNNQTLRKTLTAVSEQTISPDEIIVAGLDEAQITAAFPHVRFVSSGEPRCAAYSRNLGIQSATGDVLLFTDSDCLPANDWVEKHLAAQENGRLIVGGGIEIANPNYWARSDNVSMFHEFATTAAAGTRSLLPTLNLSVHRSVIEAVGLLDDTFPGAAGEDSDWTIRMRQQGYALVFDPAIVVHHAPARVTFRDIQRHWQRSGYNNIRVRFRYADEFGTPSLIRNPFWLRLLSPLIALSVTAKIYGGNLPWRYWTSLPVVWLTKLIYCWGAARSIEDGFAFE